MKKRVIIMGIVGLLCISGCSKQKEEKTAQTTDSSTSQSTSETNKTTGQSEQTTETTQMPEESETKKSEDQLFDELPEAVRIVLYAHLVDHRVEQYPGLEGMTLLYQVVNNEVFLQLTSGAGSGHPIYHLAVGENIIKPIAGVCYMGAGSEHPYENVAVPSEETSKSSLYQTYLANQTNMDTASQKVQLDDHLQESFQTAQAAIGQ